MNSTLNLMATNNSRSTDYLIKILDKVSVTILQADRHSYYKSLEALFSHLLGTEVFYLDVLNLHLPRLNLNLETEKNFLGMSTGQEKMVKYEQAKGLLHKTNTLWQTIAETLTTEELAKTIDFYGMPVTLEWIVVSNFSSALHHRGQISQILDEIGMKHDMMMLSEA